MVVWVLIYSCLKLIRRKSGREHHELHHEGELGSWHNIIMWFVISEYALIYEQRGLTCSSGIVRTGEQQFSLFSLLSIQISLERNQVNIEADSKQVEKLPENTHDLANNLLIFKIKKKLKNLLFRKLKERLLYFKAKQFCKRYFLLIMVGGSKVLNISMLIFLQRIYPK